MHAALQKNAKKISKYINDEQANKLAAVTVLLLMFNSPQLAAMASLNGSANKLTMSGGSCF